MCQDVFSEKCGARWLLSQNVFCELLPGHAGMHESDYESDLGEEGHLWWGQEVEQ